MSRGKLIAIALVPPLVVALLLGVWRSPVEDLPDNHSEPVADGAICPQGNCVPASNAEARLHLMQMIYLERLHIVFMVGLASCAAAWIMRSRAPLR